LRSSFLNGLYRSYIFIEAGPGMDVSIIQAGNVRARKRVLSVFACVRQLPATGLGAFDSFGTDQW
jgi:hypothetical protein